MRILIDIGHPGHVHLYRNLIQKLNENGHIIYVTVKQNLDSAKSLLTLYKIPFTEIGEKEDNIISKAVNQFRYDWQIFSLVRKNKIQIGIGTSLTISHVSKLCSMESIVFDDDDDAVQPLFTKFAHPFCDVLLSPDCLKGQRKKKGTICYAGYHELAYLHPKRFIPDFAVLKEAGIEDGEKYFVLRFNSFKAHHDLGAQGLSIDNKRKLVEILSKKGKVFITTEREIDKEFKPFQIKIAPHKIHSFLYFATMFLGDSQTMTSEAAVLGTPAIRSNSFVGRIAYLEEEEYKYGLTFGFLPDHVGKIYDKIEELLSMPDLKQEWQRRRGKMLADKIDVTAFMVWFVENYPQSFSIMKKNPEYQYNFGFNESDYKNQQSPVLMDA